MQINELISNLYKTVETNTPIDGESALAILSFPPEELPSLLAPANALRRKNFGDTLHNCSITNAKSGSCSEDCAFCAQSAHHKTAVQSYKMQESEKIVDAYQNASNDPINRFGVVTSGEGLNTRDIDTLIEAIKLKKISGVEWCASAGIVSREDLLRMKEAGLTRFHHNLETAASFFTSICTTHKYEERIEMVKEVQRAGLSLCCGGIIGLGETQLQRVEFAQTLSDLDITSIPLNFLVPVAGTKLEKLTTIPPMDIIRTIALFRFTNPKAEIKVAAGRTHLRDLQSLIFYAGATGMMVGDLLTVAGRGVKEDKQMLSDLEIEKN